ncbi:MAG: S9 family peptidase [Anaerolineae bacterium]|nr:S9 family peptidase [Candidatus Roseilinea sp.]MDW8448781.1 S9 family peptidase [Anaerolineae bacterium]
MKPITPESLYDIVLLDDVRVSPDGAYAAFVRTSVDRSGNKYNRTIWIKDLTDRRTPARPLTSSVKDGSPRWSPDGRYLAFISTRDEKPQVFVLPIREPGEARSVTSHPNGVEAFEWSPDGKRIAFTARMRADECAREDETAAKDEGRKTEDGSRESVTFKDAWELKREKEQKQHEEEMRLDPRVISRVPYRTGTTFIEDRYAHIYVIGVPASFAEPNDARAFRLTPNDTAANFAPPAWSADGATIYSAYTRDPDSGDMFRYADLVRFDAGNADPNARRFERIPLANYTCYTPMPSPDGRWLAFDRSFEDPAAYQPGTLTIAPLLPDGAADMDNLIDLTDVLDRSLVAFVWSPDSRFLYFTLNKDGAINLWRARIPRTPRARRIEIQQVTDAVHEINGFSVLADGRVVFIASTPGDPSALYELDLRGRVRPLYRPNAKFLAEHAIGRVEAVRYRSDGRAIQGWVITPPDFDPGKKYPLIVQMHGGPHVMWGAATRSIWHEFQAMAAAGYVVFYCNPRGSDGYGRDFWHANRADWGDGPMHDVLRGVDLIAGRDYIDAARLCLTGGSYAGYLTAWIIGRDHRFVAACAQRGVYNLVSMRNTTDIPFFNDREMGGITPWDDVQALWSKSPISLVPNMRTPLLIEHSEQDYRVPIEQAEQLFQAMRLQKKTVELVRWPREGHELSRNGEPRHRVERIQRIIRWFNTYARREQ